MEGTAGVQPSIHHRRRYWYALWVVLLACSVGLAAWWETPASRGTGRLDLSLQGQGVVQGAELDYWVGPRGEWRGESAPWQGTIVVQDPSRPVNVPTLTLKLATRRLHQGYIPRGTYDLVVLRLRQPGQSPRYAKYDLKNDLLSGVMAPHRHLFVTISMIWKNFPEDSKHPRMIT